MKITSSERKYYSGISGKGLINSLGLKTIRSSNKSKKSRYVITNFSLKGISKIIKEFEKFPYEGYVQKRSKHEPNDSYFYLSRHLAKCTMRTNSHVGPVITQITNTQKMNISETNMQNIPNLHVYYSY